MKGVIDRFEGQYAIVLMGKDEIRVEIPKVLLPGGAKEGSWLRVGFELDLEEEKGQRETIKEIHNKLKNK
ncbi:MAG TPA: DUF3006 domain-containing protein [Paludibacter sp.]|nr:DUF3006 domain-containing protein [Paludibacter sp.]